MKSYQEVTLKKHIDHLKSRFEKSKPSDNFVFTMKLSVGRPNLKLSNVNIKAALQHKKGRENELDKEKCALCQEVNQEQFHNVAAKKNWNSI